MGKVRVCQRILFALAVVSAVAVCSGCGGQGNQSVDLQPGVDPAVIPAADIAAPEPPALPGIPQDAYVSPEEITARRGSAISIIELAGSQPRLKSGNVELDEESSTARLHSSAETPDAWAMYAFTDMLVSDTPLSIIAGLGTGNRPAELYIGVADYGRNRWQWFGFNDPQAVSQVLIPEDMMVVSPGGSVYVLVHARGTDTAVLNNVLLIRDHQTDTVVNFNASDEAFLDKVVLTWDPLPTADGYEIRYRIESGGAPPSWRLLAMIENGDTASFEHTLTAPAGHEAEFLETYRYEIRAVFGGEWSNSWSADVGRIGVPPVSNFQATDGFFPDRIELSWDVVPGVNGYRIEYLDPPSIAWQLLRDLSGDDKCSFEHTLSAPPGHEAIANLEYTYQIRALGGLYYYSSAVQDVGKTGPGVPSDVTGFAATDGLHPDKIVLTWDRAEYGSGYLIEVAEADGGAPFEWQTLVSFMGNWRTSFEHTTSTPPGREAEPLLLYNYRIKATGGDDYSQNWDSDYGFAGNRIPPDIAYLTASDGTYNTEVHLHWAEAFEADGYYLEYRSTSGGTPADWVALTTILDGSERNYVHSAVEPTGKGVKFGSQYEYRIKAVLNEVMSQNWASDFGYSGDVQEFTATSGWYEERIDLSWKHFPDADGFMIEYRNTEGGDPADWQPFAELNNGETTGFIHTETVPVGREAEHLVVYEYRIKAEINGVWGPVWVSDEGFRGVGVGDWPMAGHDSRHTRQSTRIGPATAELKWETTEYIGFNSQAISLGQNDTIYAGGIDGLASFTAAGSLSWQYETPEYSTAPAVLSDGTAVFLQRWGPLTAVDPAGNLLWQYTATSGRGSLVIAPDQTLYFGDEYGTLHSVNPDGTGNWTFPTGAAINTTPAVGDDGTVYVYSNDLNVYAVDPTGNQIWAYPTEETSTHTFHSWPAVGADGTIYIGCLDGRFHAINSDGTRQWVFSTGDTIVSSPAIAADGTIYTGSCDDNLHALNPDGTVKWSYLTGGDVCSAPAIDGAGNIYFNSGDHFYYSLSPGGSVRWSYDTGWYQGSDLAIGSDGTVYFIKHWFSSTSLLAFGPGE